MQIGRYDITIKRGDTYRQDFLFRYQKNDAVVNLTGIIAAAEVRPSKDSPILTQTMTCQIYPAEGRIQLSIPSADTAKIKAGFYEWDLKLIDTNAADDVSYDIEGQFIVTGSVTEP